MSDPNRLDQIVSRMGDALRSRFGPTLAVRSVERIPGQASNRIYFRVALDGEAGPKSLILVQLPEDATASEEAGGSGNVAELPFCSLLRFLDSLGLPVPQLHFCCSNDGFLIQEDLGPVTMFNALAGASPAVTASLYKQAIDLLVRFQKATWVPVAAQDPCACVGYSRRFSPDLLQWEIDHFTQWAFLDWAQARPMPSQSDFINRQAARIVAELAGSPYALAHRDFQSTNLMLPTADRMVLIDFQDALMAPPVYDLVSLLRDSYVQLPAPLLEELISYYWQQAAGYFPASNEEAFLRLFHLQTLQRKLKDAGRFVFIDRMKGNPSFLKWVEPTLGYVAHAFSSLPEYKGLREVLALYLPILR